MLAISGNATVTIAERPMTAPANGDEASWRRRTPTTADAGQRL